MNQSLVHGLLSEFQKFKSHEAWTLQQQLASNFREIVKRSRAVKTSEATTQTDQIPRQRGRVMSSQLLDGDISRTCYADILSDCHRYSHTIRNINTLYQYTYIFAKI